MKMISNVEGICVYKTQSGHMVGTTNLPDFLDEFRHASNNVSKKLSEIFKRPSNVNDQRVSWRDQLKAVRKHIN